MRRNRSRLLFSLGFLSIAFVCILLFLFLALVNIRDGLSPLEIGYLSLWLSGREEDINTAPSTDDTAIVFVVNPGDTAGVIGQNLRAQNLIGDAELFSNYVRFNGLDNDLEAGTYLLNRAQSLAEIALALTDSSIASVTVQILEGWRREEIATTIDTLPLLPFTGQEFLAATGPGAAVPSDFAIYVDLPVGASLEGFLYPDTYFLALDTTATEFRDRLLRTFQERVDSSLQAAAAQAGYTLYEIVTLASIAEREAAHAEEHSLITSVYLNRLTIGMNLEADPTVQYGIGFRGGTWWPDITQAEYQTAVSPYNTYLNGGLPPGPIANPSLSAIQAAIFPLESAYYYFRATCENDGYHVFAFTFEEHVANGNCP